MVSGGQLLIDRLSALGVTTIFGVPGESYLPALDALHDRADDIRFVICRMEAGAANMAAAWGRLTGEPGICFVTRGPGATHASVGVHTAMQDSLPMILLIGQVPRDQRGREAFQEIDFVSMFAPFSKAAFEAQHANELPGLIDKAFDIALSGRRGPVVISLPEDVLSEPGVAPRVEKNATATSPRLDLSVLPEMLTGSQRPLVILGGMGWTERSVGQIAEFLQRFNLPCATGFRRKDLIDNHHCCYVGDAGLGKNPKLAARIRDADIIIAIGSRLGDVVTDGYSLIVPPDPSQRLVHIFPDAAELNRVYRATLSVEASMEAAAAALSALPPPSSIGWSEWRAEARNDYEQWATPRHYPGPINLSFIMAQLRETLPTNAIVTNGAGNYAGWLHRFFEHREFGTQVAPTSGAMGFGIPAGIAAKIAFPDRVVVSLAGDGCFLMTAQELATASQFDVPLIVLLINNGSYGTIRMYQEQHYPGRVVGTDLKNPDFVALAEAFGAHACRIATTAEFCKALEQAIECRRPSLIEIPVSAEQISPAVSITQLRARA